MSATKTELKILMLHEQGVRVDDMLEAAYRRQAAHDGAKQALRTVAKNVASLATNVDQDLQSGKVAVDDPLKVAEYAKKMIERAATMLMGAAQHQENCQLSAAGEISAYTSLVASLKKEMTSEQAKLDAQNQPQASSNGRHVTGTHPGNGIAAQRRAEEAAAAAATQEVVTVDDTPQPVKKRRGRKKKAN